jgi:ribosome-associated protein
MAESSELQVTDTVAIPLSELRYQFSRSSGPGGQHVNRTSTQVELTFDVQGSASLDESQRARVLSKLGPAIDSRGILRLTCQTTRSQARNRAEVTERLQRVLRQALHIPKPRRPTRPRRAAVERRLEEKRRAGTLKQERRRQQSDE